MLLLSTGSALAQPAVAKRDRCVKPLPFKSTEVNVVFMPYQSNVDSHAAEQVSQLMQAEALFSLSRLDRVGVIQEVPSAYDVSRTCNAQAVTERFLAARATNDTSGDGTGLLLVSGRIYEENDQIYLQTYLTMIRGGQRESWSAKIYDLEWSAHLPYVSVAFAPRAISQNELAQLASVYRHQAVYDAPSGREISPLHKFGRHGYRVLKTKGDWMEIKHFVSHRRAWLKRGQRLREMLPELDLIDALTGYLRYRVSPTTAPIEISTWCDEALQRFLRAPAGDGRSLAAVLGDAAVGMMFMLDPRVVNKRRALELFEDAVRRAPFSSDARALEAMAEILIAYSGQSQFHARSIEQKLIDAATVDPTEQRAAANLQSFYRLLQSHRMPAGSNENERIPDDEAAEKLRQFAASMP